MYFYSLSGEKKEGYGGGELKMEKNPGTADSAGRKKVKIDRGWAKQIFITLNGVRSRT
jgi:hypothetical protein